MGILDRLTKKTVTYKDLEDSDLYNALGKFDSKPQLVRTPIGPNAYIHSSSLEDFCARRAAILDKSNSVPREYVQGSMKVVWAIGRAVERHVRDALIDSMGKSSFYGVWSCRCGKTKHKGLGANIKCDSCGTTTNYYEELTIYDDEYNIASNPDLRYVNEDKQHTIIEIKSMNGDDFDKLDTPKDAHVRQAARYVKFARRSGSVVSGKVKVVYVRKDFIYNGIYKIFTVDTDTKRYEKLVEDELIQAVELKKYFSSGELPERVFCSSAMSPMAKKCAVCSECFR